MVACPATSVGSDGLCSTPRARTFEVWTLVIRKALLVALNIVVVLALVGGTAAFADAAKHVTLVVDGSRRVVSTYVDSVGALLNENEVQLREHDVVTPDVNAALPDGSEVVVSFARLVTVDLDGRTRQVWTTASTVGQFVGRLRQGAFGAVAAAPASQVLPRTGGFVSVRLPDTLVIRHDTWRTTIVTAAPTVGAALRQAHVHLTKDDAVSLPLSTPLDHRLAVTVTQVRLQDQRRRVALPFRTITRPDSSLLRGQTALVRPGHKGVAWADVQVIIRDGQVVQRQRTVLRVLRRPVARIERVGTATQPAAPVPPSVTQPVPTVASASQLNWAALAQCESGGIPWAVSPYGYYGLYQFALGTWYGVGGTGNPVDATAAEQTYRAELLYERAGSAPWPVCGYLLYS
jgi:resuscitation-promoting factor RpfB